MIGVIVVVGVRLYRDGLVLALEQSDGIEVVATLPDLSGLTRAIPRCGSDVSDLVLLLDVATDSGLSGVVGVSTAAPRLPVVALGLQGSTAEIVGCAEAGASGYVTRDASIADLVGTITGVARGEFRCPPQVAAALIRRVGVLAGAARRRPATDPLSNRELEIVALIEDGLSNKQIAARLFITLATVKNHVHRILEKLGVEGRHEAAAWVRGQQLCGSVPAAPGHAQPRRSGQLGGW